MKRRFIRKVAAIAGIVAAPAAISLTAATPASAAPTGCYSYVNLPHNLAGSYCSGGSGTHQVVAVCSDGDLLFGPRVRAGRDSLVWCDRWGQPPSDWWVSSHSFWVYN